MVGLKADPKQRVFVQMRLGQAIRYRAMKIAGNTSKIALHAHLKLFPKARRDLPVHEPARLQAPAGKIPRIVWQTNHTRSVTLQLYACHLFNRWLSPTCEYRYCDDDACDGFVAANYPGRIAEAYSRLRIGAARADFWRILVLLKHGGIYLDIDANFTRNPEQFLGDDPRDVFISMKNGEVTNYFIASAPGNPILADVCDRIVANIEAGKISSVYHMTGPTVLDAAVRAAGARVVSFKEACVQGQFTNKAGQYADKPSGAWHVEQQMKPIVAPPGNDG